MSNRFPDQNHISSSIKSGAIPPPQQQDQLQTTHTCATTDINEAQSQCLNTPSPARRPRSTPLSLPQLPYDILGYIIRTLMRPVRVGHHARLVEQSYRNALPLALTSRTFYHLFMRQLTDCEFWQSARIDDDAVCGIARHANVVVRRMILRKCNNITRRSLVALATHCPNLRTIDLSYVDICDDDLGVVLSGVGDSLRELYLRGCVRLTDVSLRRMGKCGSLEAVDICGLELVTDVGMEELAGGLGDMLKMIVCSGCVKLTDRSLCSLGRSCRKLEEVTCRGLCGISNEGLDALCRGVGESLSILDVLECDQLNVRSFLGSVRRFCPRLARKIWNAEGKTLKQVVISSLFEFVFQVTGTVSDGSEASYFVLVDSGTRNSFHVSLCSSTLELTNYGIILASCYGDRPNDQVRTTLLLYGLALPPDEDESPRDG